MKRLRRKIFVALVCFCTMCLAATPCFVFGVEGGAELTVSKPSGEGSVELDDSLDCGDSFLDFAWLVDIIMAWIR